MKITRIVHKRNYVANNLQRAARRRSRDIAMQKRVRYPQENANLSPVTARLFAPHPTPVI